MYCYLACGLWTGAGPQTLTGLLRDKYRNWEQAFFDFAVIILLATQFYINFYKKKSIRNQVELIKDLFFTKHSVSSPALEDAQVYTVLWLETAAVDHGERAAQQSRRPQQLESKVQLCCLPTQIW